MPAASNTIVAPRLAADGILNHPESRNYFALYPNLFLFGSPGQHFLHTVMPLGADKSRGVIRIYWIGEDETASTRYAREAALAEQAAVAARTRAAAPPLRASDIFIRLPLERGFVTV